MGVGSCGLIDGGSGVAYRRRSGSDYTAFLQRYGVASGDIGYSGGPGTPVYHYHSIYDSFTWQDKLVPPVNGVSKRLLMTRYGDPGFHKHVEASKILGLLCMAVRHLHHS